MNKLICCLLLLICANNIFAQETLKVSFFVNDTYIDIEKEVVSLKKDDALKIRLQYSKNFNIEAVKIITFQLTSAKKSKKIDDQQQSQKMSKMILTKDKEKNILFNLKGARDFSLKISLNEIYTMSSSKIKIYILNCKDESGKKIHRNNKSYEIYMPIYKKNK